MQHPINKFLKSILPCVYISIGFFSSYVYAAPIVLNPVDDGSIRSSGTVNTSIYLTVSGDTRGVIEFSTNQITTTISQALLSVNPYGLPLHGLTVQVFAYESFDGQLTFSDYNSGTFLGNWMLSDTLGYGEDTYFDVTTFMKGISSPYVGFNLRTGLSGTDVFSSLEYNYGHPSQLIISTVPIPDACWILGSGIIGLAWRTYRRKKG